MTAVHTHHVDPLAPRDTHRAWWSLLGFVPSFFLAFVVGEGLISLFGYPVGDEQPPWWAMLGASVPAMVVFVLPAVAAVHFGRRAVRLGDPRGRAPMLVALVLAVGFVGLNVVQGVALLFVG